MTHLLALTPASGQTQQILSLCPFGFELFFSPDLQYLPDLPTFRFLILPPATTQHKRFYLLGGEYHRIMGQMRALDPLAPVATKVSKWGK